MELLENFCIYICALIRAVRAVRVIRVISAVRVVSAVKVRAVVRAKYIVERNISLIHVLTATEETSQVWAVMKNFYLSC